MPRYVLFILISIITFSEELQKFRHLKNMSTQPCCEEKNRIHCTENIFRADPAHMLTNMNTFRIGPIKVQDNELIFMHDSHNDDNVHGLRKTISVTTIS
jgi:hypothetical protein